MIQNHAFMLNSKHKLLYFTKCILLLLLLNNTKLLKELKKDLYAKPSKKLNNGERCLLMVSKPRTDKYIESL